MDAHNQFYVGLGESARDELTDLVNDLLDCVERPVSTLAPAIPPTPASRRAIVALFDAVGRNL